MKLATKATTFMQVAKNSFGSLTVGGVLGRTEEKRKKKQLKLSPDKEKTVKTIKLKTVKSITS